MPLKVLFVIDTLGAGGSERSLAEMLPYFQSSGIEPVVVYLKQKTAGVQREVEGESFRTRPLPGGSLAQRVLALRRMIAEERPGVVHTTLFNANMLGRLAAFGTGVPVVTSLVNTTYDPIRLDDPRISTWKMRVVQLVDAVTAHLGTTHFHAVTHAVKDAYVRDLRLPPGRITVVERGRNPDRLGTPSAERRRRAREALQLSDDATVLVTVGRQDYQKGQQYLLEALPSLLAEHPDLVVLVAGRPGQATPELERLHATLSLNGSVRFLGHREDVPELLAASDVFVFPSLFEGIGGAALEAMALGLPVVSSDLPGLREVVEDGRSALLVPLRDPGALAGAVGELLADPDRAAAMGRRGREIFEERFQLERNAARMADLFHAVAAGRSSRPGA